MPLEQFAAVTALIDAGRPRSDVLEAVDLTPQAWTEAQAGWLAKMAQEARLRRFELQSRFNELLLDHLRRLDAGRKIEVAPSVLLGRAGEAQRISEPPPRPAVEASLADAPPRVPAAAPPVFAPPAAPPPTAPVFAPAPPPPRAPMPEPARRPDTAAPPPSEAAAVPAFVAPPAPLPFREGARDGALPFASRPSSPPVAADGALPFGNRRPPAPATLAETTDLEALAAELSVDRALPFLRGGAEAAPRLAPRGEHDVALPFRAQGKRATPLPAPPEIDDDLSGTLTVSSPEGPPRLTLEQFASLEAELRCHPDRAEAVRSRYGMNAAAFAAERLRWAHRFLDDAELSQRYKTKLDEFIRWLEVNG